MFYRYTTRPPISKIEKRKEKKNKNQAHVHTTSKTNIHRERGEQRETHRRGGGLDSGFGGNDGCGGSADRLQGGVVAASHGGTGAEHRISFRSPEIGNRGRRKQVAGRCNHGFGKRRIEKQRKKNNKKKLR